VPGTNQIWWYLTLFIKQKLGSFSLLSLLRQYTLGEAYRRTPLYS
jgi:hypothetical protein